MQPSLQAIISAVCSQIPAYAHRDQPVFSAARGNALTMGTSLKVMPLICLMPCHGQEALTGRLALCQDRHC